MVPNELVKNNCNIYVYIHRQRELTYWLNRNNGKNRVKNYVIVLCLQAHIKKHETASNIKIYLWWWWIGVKQMLDTSFMI